MASGEPVTSLRIGKVGFGLMLTISVAVAMAPTSGRAYSPEQEQACTSDAFRLCSADIPDVARVTACMDAKRSQLSPGCRVQFRPDPEPGATAAGPAGRPMAIRPTTQRKPAKVRKPKKPARPAAT